MFEREIKLYALTLAYCRRLVADVPDDRLSAQPVPGLNTPAWVLGHLAVSTDLALQILGQPGICPPQWQQAFGTGSKPQGLDPCPARQELFAALEAGHAQVADLAPRADPDRLGTDNPLALLRPLLPTAGDLLAHLLTTHEAMHLGQLSAWRRVMGLPPVLS